MSNYTTIIFSLIGGIMPALFWLWFWLKEDRLHPEPRIRIMALFLAGMASVFAVLPVERFIFAATLSGFSAITITLWAATEELFKFGAAYLVGLRGKDMDEPIDAVIYMITVALGFSAIENALFLSNLIEVGQFSQSIITGNSRFLGATLLHILSSATIGVFIGLSYYKKTFSKILSLFTGLTLSIVLHTAYNLLIIRFENDIFLVFSGVWSLIIILIVFIEKVKKNHF